MWVGSSPYHKFMNLKIRNYHFEYNKDSWIGVSSDRLKFNEIIPNAVRTASTWEMRTNRLGFTFVGFIVIDNSESDIQSVPQT
jgi:hypothetical protein